MRGESDRFMASFGVVDVGSVAAVIVEAFFGNGLLLGVIAICRCGGVSAAAVCLGVFAVFLLFFPMVCTRVGSVSWWFTVGCGSEFFYPKYVLLGRMVARRLPND